MGGVLLFCNTDMEGKIIDSLVGERVIPLQQFDHFFFISEKDLETVKQELPQYRIIDNQIQIGEKRQVMDLSFFLRKMEV
ncbi:hypothetical protein [Bacillus sp. 03113]|uniref:hypothetical protein n=1 Tax=Bacillus sp. 03113 TaxID=2578211 RepID=UPI001142B944|nr:hypothetical protein [Bacillus sp. 03113]